MSDKKMKRDSLGSYLMVTLMFVRVFSSFSLKTFPVELPVFMREHKNGMYRTDVYFLTKTIAEVSGALTLGSYAILPEKKK